MRTEIIFHLTLLLGAALLCGGLLLLKITERQLLDQRVENLTTTMEIVARTLSPNLKGGDGQGGEVLGSRLHPLLPMAGSIYVWRMADGRYTLLYSKKSSRAHDENDTGQPRPHFLAEPKVSLSYRGAWSFWGEQNDSFLEVLVPLREAGRYYGILQARFPLNDVADRARSSLSIMLLYVILYGGVLFLFGLYLLNRDVVRPINSLMGTTRLVAEGDLDQEVSEKGPREIFFLARSFNAMVGALRESRRDTEATIRSLRQANEDLSRTRDELVRSEKMASIGHLAAGMAHEIGNPLGAVVGYLELLKAELPEGRQREIAGCASEEVGRIDLLVRDLLDYAAPGESRPEIFDPAEVMEEALDLLDNQGLFNKVRVIRESFAPLPLVSMVRHQLLQVFVNLLLNACDAAGGNGEIRIDGGVETDFVWLAVIDDGEGIASENLGHIFDPFFTTKAPGKGRGLGLSVCHQVVDRAGGAVEVQSEVGRGSRFVVRLPVSRGELHGC